MRVTGETGLTQLSLHRTSDAAITLAAALTEYERLEPHVTPERRALVAAMAQARGESNSASR